MYNIMCDVHEIDTNIWQYHAYFGTFPL